MTDDATFEDGRETPLNLGAFDPDDLKVISALAAAGLLETRRGGGGGAMLARPSEDIRLGDVVAVLEADQALVECFATGSNACILSPKCQLKSRLAHAEAAFVADLNRSTLADCVYRPEGA